MEKSCPQLNASLVCAQVLISLLYNLKAAHYITMNKRRIQVREGKTFPGIDSLVFYAGRG